MRHHKPIIFTCLVFGMAVFGQAYVPLSIKNCKYYDPRKCISAGGPAGLLWILKAGTTFTYASGSLSGYSGGVKNVSVTDSRASNSYCANSSGVLVQLSNNQPCVEFGVTALGTSSGLRVEGSTTNSMLQSQALATAPWSAIGSSPPVPPTVTNATTDVTDPAGGSTATKAVFPAVSAAATFSLIRQSVNPGAGSNSISLYARVLSGTGNTFISDGTNTLSLSLTSAWTRYSIASTGSVNFDIGTNTGVGAESGGTSAVTVYIWGVQAEAQAFVSSYVPTVAATVTRAADDVEIATSPLTTPMTAWSLAATATPEGTWATPGAAGTYGKFPFVEIAPWSNPNNIVNLGMNNASNPSAFIFGATGNISGTSASTFSSNTAHRLNLQMTSLTAGTMYVDGVANTTLTNSSNTAFGSAPSPFMIGEIGAGGIPAQGGGTLNAWITNICFDISTSNCS
jgi:hypothetical protein